MSKKYVAQAYSALLKAEDKFSAELKRQFPHCREGDVRFSSWLHDQQTAAARRDFHFATVKYHAAVAAMREEAK